MSTKRYYAFDTKDMPGKVKCSYVEYGTEIISYEEFVKGEFKLIQPQEPNTARMLEVLFVGKPKVTTPTTPTPTRR